MQWAVADSKISADVVFVGGAVPRPGTIRYEKGMTIEVAFSRTGLELSQYNKEQVSDKQAFPFRVILYRKGMKTIFDPRTDAGLLRTTQVLPIDTVVLKDYRLIPDEIENRKKRLSQMIELGSFGISCEILLIARLQHEYASWSKGGGGQDLESVNSFVRNEVVSLTDKGKGRKTVDFLTLRLNEMKSGGIGPAHPDILQISALIDLFTAQQQRNKFRESGTRD
jgi:hypothetical protein